MNKAELLYCAPGRVDALRAVLASTQFDPRLITPDPAITDGQLHVRDGDETLTLPCAALATAADTAALGEVYSLTETVRALARTVRGYAE